MVTKWQKYFFIYWFYLVSCTPLRYPCETEVSNIVLELAFLLLFSLSCYDLFFVLAFSLSLLKVQNRIVPVVSFSLRFSVGLLYLFLPWQN